MAQLTVWIDRVCRVLLLATVIAVAAIVTRNFARYADHYPYLAADDALGNVSYSLATEGRYGFQTSPIQGFTNVSRTQGFFNYGPWYFYAGAGLIWVFGYSITVLRSLHLLGILAIAATACWWFGRRGQLAAGALVALGLLHSFDVGQWPMVRPDIAVSVFAVMFIVVAGRAIENGSATAWFLAGLAAGCAAFTHLIAWALVPCCLFTVAIALMSDRPGRRRSVIVLLAVAAGLVASVVMFYGSFGFRVRDHLATLRGYSGYLSGTAAAGGDRSAIVAHLRLGFSYLSPAVRIALFGAVVASLGIVVLSSRWSRAVRTPVLAVLLPPVAVSCFYVASLAVYASYHTGYVILPQVVAWWCAGALVWALLGLAERSRPSVSRVLAAATAVIVLIAGATQLYARARTEGNPRLAYAREWVSIHDYLARVGDLVTRGAAAWGAPIFGIDSPGRYELVDAVSAVAMMGDDAKLLREAEAPRIAPAYLIWGYGDNRENTMRALLDPLMQGNFNRLRDALVRIRYRLVGMVAATPYGVTRVYQRILTADDLPQRLPVVSVFDNVTQLWDGRLDGPLPATAVTTEPARFDLQFDKPRPPLRADRTVTTELPPGRYLLRIRLTGAPRVVISRRPAVLAVTSAASISETVGDLGPSVDFSPYAQADTDAFLIHSHPGGALYVSQFDKEQRSSLDGIDVYRILPALYSDQLADPLFTSLPAEPWLPLASPGVNVSVTATGALSVKGDASQGGYQIQSPVLPAEKGSIVTVRAMFVGQQGRVCIGALNSPGNWLVNGGDPLRDFQFPVDATGGFRVVFYNCNAAPSGNAPSWFTVSHMRYAIREPGAYVDQLLAALNPGPAAAPAIEGPPVRSFPAGLHLTSDEVTRIQIQLKSADLQFRAPLVGDAGEGWLLKGQAEGRYSYVLRSKPIRISAHRLVAKGVLNSGGVTIGLLKDEKWAGNVNVTEPGPFVVVVEPPALGTTYEIVVANDIDSGPLTTDVALERIGWAPLVRR
jgi:hypothetical protein